jgi:inorganic pyrophosphatase
MKKHPSPPSLESVVHHSDLLTLAPRDEETGLWQIIIETPQNSRNKYTYDESRGAFQLKKVLPLGAVFPFDFGFLPSTVADDGDPLDVLVLMDAPAFPGCIVASRLIGVIEAEQDEEGEKRRNDRLIGIASECQDRDEIANIKELDETICSQIEHFFISYHELENKPFKPLARRGPRHAEKLATQAMQRFFDQLQSAASRRASRP